MSHTYLALCCETLSTDLSGVTLRELPRRALAAGEIRVAVQAAGLNFPDLLMTRGAYQFVPPLPFVLGMEGVGIVLETGTPTHRWKPGDRVCFQSRLGACAEEIILSPDDLAAVPAALGPEQAAAFQVTAMTAWVALVGLGHLQAQEHLLVHGARGGVGSACVQLGIHLGAQVIASASNPALLEPMKRDGVTVISSNGAFHDEVLTRTNGRGADVIADPVGGDVFDESTRCIAWGGRLLVLGFASGRIPVLPANRALIKGFSMVGVRAGEYGRRNPERGTACRKAIFELAERGVFSPTVGLSLPLRAGAEALRRMENRSVVGKIVLTMPSISGAALTGAPSA